MTCKICGSEKEGFCFVFPEPNGRKFIKFCSLYTNRMAEHRMEMLNDPMQPYSNEDIEKDDAPFLRME